MNNIEYNKKDNNWFSKVAVKDTICYFDEDGRFHRMNGPALYPEEQWVYKDVNLTYNFKEFVDENNLEMNEENFKIFIFEWKLKNT